MRTRLLVALAGMVGLTGFAPAPFPKPEVKDDLKKMAGKWKVVRYSQGRNPAVTGSDTGLNATIEGGKCSFFRVTPTGIAPTSQYNLVLNRTKNPRWIDFMGGKGSGMLQGIYRWDREELHIAFHTYNVKERPTEFAGGNPRVFYLTLKREKP